MTSYMSASEAGLDTCTAAPYAESMTTVYIGIPNDQAAALRAKAAAQGLSLEEWFRALAEQSGSAAVQPESRREMRPIWEVISDNMKKVPPEDLAALRKDGASQIDHCNGTTVNIRAGNWCSGQSGTDAQFHDSIEVAVERDYPFRAYVRNG